MQTPKCNRCHDQTKIVIERATFLERFGEVQTFLEKTHYEHLCSTCLDELRTLCTLSEQEILPTKKHEFIEGIHYYWHGPYWVFTEYYHILKGQCCKNKCRHCAYGFSK